jgi:hypothetical protein
MTGESVSERNATVPVPSLNVIVLSAVGSVMVNVVSDALSVAPWNTSAFEPRRWEVIVNRSVVALPIVTSPFAVILPDTVVFPENVFAPAIV